MAIIIPGKTTCQLCKEIITETDNVVGLPHFIDDRSNPFWELSDSCVHRTCFLKWSGAEKFRRLFDARAKELQPRFPKTMQEDGSVTDDPSLASKPSLS